MKMRRHFLVTETGKVVNTKYISTIYRYGDHTVIKNLNGSETRVKESPEEVLDAIFKHGRVKK